MTERINVLIADDHAIVLEGLRALIDGEADMTVVDTVTSGQAVLERAGDGVDVIVLDLELGGMSGVAVLEALRRKGVPARVLVLTAYNDGESIRSALDAGADGLALKTEPPQQTLTAIRQVAAGQLVFPPAARRWFDERRRRPTVEETLTPRERSVWKLVANGRTNREIANAMGVSANTVKSHLQHLFAKLGVKNRTEAAVAFRALEGGRPGA